MSYRQLPSPQSPDTMFKPEPSGLDWGASLEAGQEGYREPVPEPPKGKILRSFFMKQPEMQLRGAGSAAAGQQSSANQPGELPTSHSEVVLDDCVKVTMLDDDSDTDDTGLAPIRLSVPPIPKLHTTFSLGSTASSNDDDDDEEEPETVVVSTLSPSKNKGKEKAPQEDPYAGEIIRDMRTETLMIGHADVRFGSAYLASFATDDENGVGSPSTLRLTTSTAYLGSQDTSMVQSFSTKVSQDQIAMIPSMEASEATSKDSLSMERAAVVELEAIPSLNGPVASDVPDATMPATTETSAAASNDRLMPTAAAPKHRNILTNPGSGLSDLLSLYAGMSEDGEQVRSELGEDWEDDDDDLKPLSRLQNPDSPIPTHRQLGRKGTNRTVHEVQGVTLVRRITGKQAVQSGAGSMLIADQDLEAITVDRDMSEGDTANKKFVDGGHSISFIDTVDDEFRDQ